jgi:hypothetical protein
MSWSANSSKVLRRPEIGPVAALYERRISQTYRPALIERRYRGVFFCYSRSSHSSSPFPDKRNETEERHGGQIEQKRERRVRQNVQKNKMGCRYSVHYVHSV